MTHAITRAQAPGIVGEGLPLPMEPALLASAARMAERGQHGASGGHEGRSERPARWRGQPRPWRVVSEVVTDRIRKATVLWGAVFASAFQMAPSTRAEPPARLAQVPAVPMADMQVVESTPSAAAIPPRNTGPQAMAHSRYRRGRHGTTRFIRRTPAVMREDAARVKRGDLFSTWSNEYLE